jgi:hypothetical protein
MSNTRKTDISAPIRGDYGLGLCVTCVRDYLAAAAGQAKRKAGGGGLAAPPPPPAQFAITLAPAPCPVPGPDGTIAGMTMVVLPTCYDHLMITPGGVLP